MVGLNFVIYGQQCTLATRYKAFWTYRALGDPLSVDITRLASEAGWHVDYPRQDALGCRKEHQLASQVSCPHIRPSMSSPAIPSPAISAFPLTPAK